MKSPGQSPGHFKILSEIPVYGEEDLPQMGQKIWLTLREIKKKTVYFNWLQSISGDAPRFLDPLHKRKFFFQQLVMEILTFPYGVGK